MQYSGDGRSFGNTEERNLKAGWTWAEAGFAQAGMLDATIISG